MSDPTKAAMKAAREIINDYCDRDRFCMSPQTESHKAEIIDRETGLPELIAALRDAIDDITTLINRCHAETEIGADVWTMPYREALRKAGEL